MSEQNAAEFIGIQTALAGRYSLQRELGRGGMGIVFLAHDVALDRPVALKLLQPQLAVQPALKQRFLNEARTAAKLSHPNIIPIFTVEEIGEYVFFVMAFIDGETLGQRIRNRGPVPSSELAAILREVGWGLAYAHAQGVVHRDVKADNIMLERGSGRALVVDFGIARVVQNTGSTGQGEILGTADYMSPEQASGELADHRSDIYSLGVVAFYALTGRLPFEGATVGAVLAKQITQPAPPIAELVRGVPSKLSGAVERCLAKDPAARFASAEELADAVSVALAVRREAPPQTRVFIKKSSELAQNLLWVGWFQTLFGLTGALMMATPGHLGVEVFIGFALVAFTAYPLLAAGWVTEMRSLLKSGYASDDVLAVWNRELQLDREEGVVQHGAKVGRVERAARAVFVAGMTVFATAVLARISPEKFLWADVMTPFVWAVTMVSGMVSLWRYDGRTSLSRRIAGRFLQSRVGKWMFKLAGLGLDRSKLASQATHRPTELAIGMAVDSLFEALPKETRKQFAELPAVVRDLEADAMQIRRKVEQLNEHATEDRDVIAARDLARKRLADAVTALETIRLDLLRLTAGVGNADSLTADLSDARAVSVEVQRLLEARAEVEKHLK